MLKLAIAIVLLALLLRLLLELIALAAVLLHLALLEHSILPIVDAIVMVFHLVLLQERLEIVDVLVHAKLLVHQTRSRIHLLPNVNVSARILLVLALTSLAILLIVLVFAIELATTLNSILDLAHVVLALLLGSRMVLETVLSVV